MFTVSPSLADLCEKLEQNNDSTIVGIWTKHGFDCASQSSRGPIGLQK